MENNPEGNVKKASGIFADLARSGVKLYQVYAMTPKEMNVLYEMAYNLFLEERYSEARENIKALCWLNNSNVIYWKALAAVEDKLDNYSGAENACSIVLMLEPDNHEAYVDLARYATKVKHFDIAEEALLQSLDLATKQKKGSYVINALANFLSSVQTQKQKTTKK